MQWRLARDGGTRQPLMVEVPRGVCLRARLRGDGDDSGGRGPGPARVRSSLRVSSTPLPPVCRARAMRFQLVSVAHSLRYIIYL